MKYNIIDQQRRFIYTWMSEHAMASEPNNKNSLTALYTSPTSTHTFSSALPALPASDKVQEKTDYLSSLRTNISKLQDDVNTFLTQKMEEDKAAEGAGAGGKRSKDEEREEEMYGEEDAGED